MSIARRSTPLPHPSDDAAWNERMTAAFHELFQTITPPKSPEPWVIPVNQENEE